VIENSNLNFNGFLEESGAAHLTQHSGIRGIMNNSNFFSNIGNRSGALLLETDSPVIINCQFKNNSARGSQHENVLSFPIKLDVQVNEKNVTNSR